MKSNEEKRNIFTINIATVPQEEGCFSCQFQSINDGVPTETVITQLSAFLHNLKKECFDGFDEGAVKFREE